MISAFQSHEFGFGLLITPKQLVEINESRRGKYYVDEAAAIAKRGSKVKKPLTCSPLAVKFEYGANNEGYWSYDHMVLQLEDCVECIKVIASQFDVMFLFDHSCGPDKQREDGLYIERISKNFRGKQSYLHSSLIKEASYLGP
jgi:hypothetical protein